MLGIYAWAVGIIRSKTGYSALHAQHEVQYSALKYVKMLSIQRFSFPAVKNKKFQHEPHSQARPSQVVAIRALLFLQRDALIPPSICEFTR